MSSYCSSFRQKFYPDVSFEDWMSWTWQMRHQIKTKQHLAQILNLTESESQALERQDKFSFAINPYYASLLESDPQGPLRRTLVATMDEWRGVEGESEDPLGEEHHRPVAAVVHRYPDRALFLATGLCAVYCRYCTRSRLVGDVHEYKTEMQLWQKGFDYISQHTEIRDVLITGGDPFTLSDEKLEFILKNLRSIRHVEFIRIGTKVPMALPQRITDKLCAVLKKYNPVFLSLHVIHPQELTREAREACEKLADAGLPLGSQTVLLKGINDNVDTARELFHNLLKIRVKPYYLFHCDPLYGSSHFRTSVQKGVDIIEGLRGHTTGYAIPHYAIDMAGSGGKVALVPQSIIEKKDNFIVFKNFRGEEHRYLDGSDDDGVKIDYNEEELFMPSFDIVSKVNLQEVENGVNQAKAEIANRFDFRGSATELLWDKKMITFKAPDDYKMNAIKDILQSKLHRRGVDISCMKFSEIEHIGGMMQKQTVELKQGIERELAKKICAAIRDSKIKVQTQIINDKINVSSKSIDSLQECIAFVRRQDFGQPLQFDNMR